MGTEGVTAATHFDENYNFFIQVHGNKTFYLSQPSVHWNLYVSPYVHPMARQSQVDLEGIKSDNFPKFKDIPTYKVCVFERE